MIQDKIKQSFKNMRGSKSYLLINIGGLSIAFAVFILIMLFVVNEFNFDKFNTNGDRVYRIEVGEQNQVPMSISRTSKEVFPEVENTVMIKSTSNHWISYEKNFFEIRDFCFAENSFFEMFSVPFVMGDPKTALIEPFTIVLAESLAKKIFGDKNPIGQQVNFKNQNDYTVTGVIKDLPDFHLPAKAVASFKSVEVSFNLTDENWSWNLISYVMLSDNHDKELLEKKMDKQFRNIEQWNVKEPEFLLRSFNDIYLDSDTEANDETKHGSMTLLIILMVVGALIILIASINFINLTISRGLKKANIIHIRRILGSSKTAIIVQYMIDSVILVAISVLIAFAIVYWSLPLYENLINKELNILNIFNIQSMHLIVSGIITLGIIYGLVPAYFLLMADSRQRLRGGQVVAKRTGFNVGLITFQYAISIVLICGTIITYKQLVYTQNSNLGLNKEQVLSIDLVPLLRKNLPNFKSRLLETPHISGVSFVSDNITQFKQYGTMVNVDEKRYVFKYAIIDPDFIPLMNIELLQGENFSEDIKSQMSEAYILNEAAWDIMKNSKTKDDGYAIGEHRLLGVIKNFHFESFHNKIEPMIFYWAPKDYHNKALLKLTTGNITQSLSYIDKIYNEMAPGSLCKYQFVDEEFKQLYTTERMMVKLLGIFSLLAILIATLGIISLSTMAAETRTKEIGIRKVNGAQISDVVVMLNKDFLKWVTLAFIVAVPIAYFVMNKWLENFSYKTNLSWWIFALSGLLAFVIALLTVSLQSWKAARKNPIEALRYE